MSTLQKYEALIIFGIFLVDCLATYYMYRMWMDSRTQQGGPGYHV